MPTIDEKKARQSNKQSHTPLKHYQTASTYSIQLKQEIQKHKARNIYRASSVKQLRNGARPDAREKKMQDFKIIDSVAVFQMNKEGPSCIRHVLKQNLQSKDAHKIHQTYTTNKRLKD